MAERLERRFYPVIAENPADTECILGQHSDDFLQRDNFDVLLDARVEEFHRRLEIRYR